MLKYWRWLLVLASLLIVVIWIAWWVSLGAPSTYEICSDARAPYNCENYNILFYSAWAFAKAADHWSALITAVATGMIGIFTYTLYRATTGLVESAKIQSDDMKRSIVASENSATAPMAQADIAKKALTDIERPYLFIINVGSLTIQEFYDFDDGEVG